MQLFLALLTAFALSLWSAIAQDPFVNEGKSFGNPNSKVNFNDTGDILPGIKITSAWIGGDQRVTGVGLQYVMPDGKQGKFEHGVKGGAESIIEDGERIYTVVCNFDSEGIVYLEFDIVHSSNGVRSIHGGKVPDDPNSVPYELKAAVHLVGFAGTVVNSGFSRLIMLWVDD